MSHWSTQSSSYDTQISEHAIETGKEPGECLFSTHSTVLGSSTTPQRKNTCPPLILGIVACESSSTCPIDITCACKHSPHLPWWKTYPPPSRTRHRPTTRHDPARGGRCQLRGPGTQSTKRSSRPCQKILHTPPPPEHLAVAV